MNETNLRKLIEEYNFTHWVSNPDTNCDSADNEIEEDVEGVIDKEEILQWLNAAEIDFPKLPKNPNTADRINHSIECLEWFSKWLEKQR